MRRVRVPSQSSDVDQYLDDLFMPVLDGNIDEFSDARSLANSLKGSQRKLAENREEREVGDFIDRVIDDDSLDDEWDHVKDPAKLAALIQGGGRGVHNTEKPVDGSHFQPIGINIGSPQLPIPTTYIHPSGMISPSPLLMPGLVAPMYRGDHLNSLDIN